MVLLLWLLPQLISIGLSAWQVRFSYRWIDPPQKWAMEQLLAIQFISASLFIYNSLRDWRFAVIAFSTGSAMISLAFVLAIPSFAVWISIAGLGLWLLTLHGFASCRAAAAICQMFNVWLVGGVILQYTSSEFDGGKLHIWYSPFIALLSILHHWNDAALSWTPLIFLGIVGLLAKLLFSDRSSISRQFVPR